MYYIPEIGSNNLLSVTYMVNKGYFVGFGAHKCEISKGDTVIGEAEKRRNIWILQGVTIPPVAESAHIVKASLKLWHKCLGHAMTRSVKKLLYKSMVTGLDIADTISRDLKEPCELCLKGKSTHNVIPKKSDVENPWRLHRVFSDVCGPFDIEEHN